MRCLLASLTILTLSATAGAAAAEEPATNDAQQRVSLPGYDISIEVPADWEVDPVPGGTTAAHLYEGSPFTLGMWRLAGSRDAGQWCYVKAYSRLGCAAPVDLESEIAGLDPEWREYPMGSVARVNDDSIDGAACVRHLTTDGVDVYEVGCCGAETPADEWRSIVDTLELPAETRPARVAATGRSLVEDAEATTQLWVSVHAPNIPGGLYGESWTRTASERAGDRGVAALVDAVALPADSISVTGDAWRDDAGREVLAVDGVQAPGAAPDAVRAGMLAWAEAESPDSRGARPSIQTVETAGFDALRLTAADSVGATYVVAEGDSAVKVRAATDALALGWLEALPCDYLDFQRLRADALSVTWPDD